MATKIKMQSPAKVAEFMNYLMSQEPRILFDILNKLPKMGVGRKVTRVNWNVQDTNHLVRPAYWTITKVIPNEVRSVIMIMVLILYYLLCRI